MIANILLAAAIAAVLVFTLAQRKRMMTELESLNSSIEILKATNRQWMTFMDGFADKLKAIETAVLTRNPGGASDEQLLEQLAEAQDQLASMKAGVVEASRTIADEHRLVASNVAVAESMVEGMITSGDPYNGAMPD